MYINSRLMEVEKEKYKKWYVVNVDSENSNFSLKKDIKIHGDINSDGWDDGNLEIQNSDEEKNHSLLASSRIHIQDSKDEYTFHDNENDHLKDLQSIATYVNGKSILNNNNVFQKSFTIEDVEDVVTTTANCVGEIGIEEEKLPPCIFTKNGYASRGGEKGKDVVKTIGNLSLKVSNATVKGKLVVEEFGPINRDPLKYRKENASF